MLGTYGKRGGCALPWAWWGCTNPWRDAKYPREFGTGIPYFRGYQIPCDTGRPRSQAIFLRAPGNEANQSATAPSYIIIQKRVIYNTMLYTLYYSTTVEKLGMNKRVALDMDYVASIIKLQVTRLTHPI